MKIERFHLDADRYYFDFGRCSYANGYAQIDSRQDASYFGTWCSPEQRKIVCYCEGDVSTKTTDTDEEFVAELRELVRWSDEAGHGPTRIDPGLQPDFKAKFEALGVADLLH